MKLQNIELANFKNYESAQLQFDAKFVCFTGKNGQGKTNLLDAMHYLSLTKSFLNPGDINNIRHEDAFFRISGNFLKDDGSFHSVACIQERGSRKKIIVNDKTVDRFADHIGEFPVVVISPADFDLFNSAEERRKFVDSTISQFDKTYLDNLIQYNRVLTQRNRLLKNISERKEDTSLLQVFDLQLEQLATPIHKMRVEFLQGFLPYFNNLYKSIAGLTEKVETIYETQLEENLLHELLEKNRQRDIALGHTSVGIHREDFLFNINGFPARKFGSQGQQKSYLISLKLAKHKYIGDKKKNIPLLLLDDLHDKLDSSRVGRLFKILKNNEFHQVFITDTQKERLYPLMKSITDPIQFFNIHKGQAKSEKL